MSTAGAQRVICEYLSDRFGIAREKLTSAARFQEDLGLDSFEVTELLVSIEDETGIDLGLARLITIDDVASIGALAVTVSRAATTPAGTPAEGGSHDQAKCHSAGEGQQDPQCARQRDGVQGHRG